MHVKLSHREVRRKLARLRRKQFHSRAAFRRFRRKTGETVGDLLLRVRIEMLGQRMQRRVISRVHTRAPAHSKKFARAQQRALTQFVVSFRNRWRRRTYCLPDYQIADCGHRLR